MAAILGDILKYLKVKKEINRDNLFFRIVTDATFGVFILSSIIAGLTSHFGKPIICHSEEENPLISSHCWLHGTRDLDGSLELEDEHCVDSNDDNKNKNLYYQWVIFALILSGIMFKIPAWIWKIAEGGLMEIFYDQSRKSSKILKHDKAQFRLEVEEQAATFRKIKGTWANSIYYIKFLICQLMAVLILALTFHCTDLFLNNKFGDYGSRVIKYYQEDENGRKQLVNPMCNTFPTRVNCFMKITGKGGNPSNFNDFCILAQNIINEKIYLLLWFWFVAMFIFASVQILLEICILALPFIRQMLTFQQVGSSGFLTSNVKAYLKKCTIGDWFVLYQIGKNTHKDFYFELLKQLADEDLDEESTTPMLEKEDKTNEVELKTVKSV